MREHEYEKLLNIKTEGYQLGYPRDIQYHRYEPTPYLALEQLFNEYEFGNAVNPNEYINTKNKLINQYNIIFPGHDSVIKNGLNEYNDELVRF